MDACGCEPDGYTSIFDRRNAEHDRDRYRRDGPDKTTRMLLELLAPYRAAATTVLDVGGGIGIVEQELLRAVPGRAVIVDGSAASIEVGREEADRLGLGDRVEFVQGDFVRLAGGIAPADLVVLDRVICCYPDMERLVRLSAERARVAYGLVLPRNRFVVRVMIDLQNLWFRLRRNPYRAFLHPNATVDELAAALGLRSRAERRTPFWRVVVYDRAPVA